MVLTAVPLRGEREDGAGRATHRERVVVRGRRNFVDVGSSSLQAGGHTQSKGSAHQSVLELLLAAPSPTNPIEQVDNEHMTLLMQAAAQMRMLVTQASDLETSLNRATRP